jgi:hypothetical protein
LRFYIKYSDGVDQEVELREQEWNTTRNGEWQHLVVTFKRGESFSLYINGELIDTEIPKSTAGLRLSSSNNDWIIGGRQKSSGSIDRNLDADIDDLVISNLAYTPQQVQDLYQSYSIIHDPSLKLDIPFNEGLGDSAKNKTNYSGDAELHNNAGWTADANGAGLSLDGINDVARIIGNEDITLTSEFTYAFWVKTSENRLGDDSSRQRELIYRRGSNLMVGYELGMADDIEWLRFFIKYPDGSTQEAELREDTAPSTRDGNWHHIAVSFKQDDHLQMFINGQLVDREPTKRSLPIRKSSSNNDLIIGGREKSDGTIDRNIIGAIKKLMLYDRVLSDQEILALYEAEPIINGDEGIWLPTGGEVAHTYHAGSGLKVQICISDTDMVDTLFYRIEGANEWSSVEIGSANRCVDVHLGELDSGSHTLELRYSDSLNNSSEINFSINVVRNTTINPVRRVRFIHTDLLGSPTAETDENGESIE